MDRKINGPKLCRTCVHHTFLNGTSDGQVVCYYLINTGHRRPCPAGDGCTEYRKGRPLTTPKSPYFF